MNNYLVIVMLSAKKTAGHCENWVNLVRVKNGETNGVEWQELLRRERARMERNWCIWRTTRRIIGWCRELDQEW